MNVAHSAGRSTRPSSGSSLYPDSESMMALQPCGQVSLRYFIRLMYTNLPQICKASMWLPETVVHRRPNRLVKLFDSTLAGKYFQLPQVKTFSYGMLG